MPKLKLTDRGEGEFYGEPHHIVQSLHELGGSRKTARFRRSQFDYRQLCFRSDAFEYSVAGQAVPGGDAENRSAVSAGITAGYLFQGR